MDSLLEDLSVCTKNFDLVTLTLTFDLLFKKLNLGFNFWTKRDRAFILQVGIPCGKTFLFVPKVLTLWPWPWLLTYFSKNLTLAITFESKEIRLSYYICGFLMTRPFLSVPKIFDPVTLTLTFDLLFKKLNLSHNFWIKTERSYYTCVFLVVRPLHWYQNFSTYDLDINFCLNFDQLKMLYPNYFFTGV